VSQSESDQYLDSLFPRDESPIAQVAPSPSDEETESEAGQIIPARKPTKQMDEESLGC
jgi:hypothetical protein